MLKDCTSARHLPSISPLITVNLCHTHRQETVAVHSLLSLPAARITHLLADKNNTGKTSEKKNTHTIKHYKDGGCSHIHTHTHMINTA